MGLLKPHPSEELVDAARLCSRNWYNYFSQLISADDVGGGSFSGAPLTPEQFGANGDGSVNDTDACVKWLAEMQGQHRAGLLQGTYLVNEGVLKWQQTGPDDVPGPWIETVPGAGFIAAGAADAPILTFENTTGLRFVTGGYIGDLIFTDLTGHVAPNRCAIELSGVQAMRFGYLIGNTLRGDLVKIRSKTTGGDPGSADQWHVFACYFYFLHAFACEGWTLNNDSLHQTFNINFINIVSTVHGGHGAVRGAGAGNYFGWIDALSPKGWAVDFAMTSPTTGGAAVYRTTIAGGELDAPEFGVRIDGIAIARINNLRINHRFGPSEPDGGGMPPDTVAWPKEAIRVGGDGHLTRDIDINVIHRISPSVSAGTVGQFLVFGQNPAIFPIIGDPQTTEVRVHQFVLDNGTGLVIGRDRLSPVGVNANSYGVRVWWMEQLLYNSDRGYSVQAGASQRAMVGSTLAGSSTIQFGIGNPMTFIAAGMLVNGSGIPANAFVLTVDLGNGTSIPATVTLDGVVAGATGSPTLTFSTAIRPGGYSTNVVPFNGWENNPNSDYDIRSCKWECPFTSVWRVHARILLGGLAAGDLVRMAVMGSPSGGGLLFLGEMQRHAQGPVGNADTYEVSYEGKIAENTLVYISATQATGSPISVSPGSTEGAANRIEISPAWAS